MSALDDNKKPKKRLKNWRETATAAQYAKILELLKPNGNSKSTHDLRRAGIMQPAARIKELRDRFGYPIQRVALQAIYDDWGYSHRGVAFYAIIVPIDKRPL